MGVMHMHVLVACGSCVSIHVRGHQTLLVLQRIHFAFINMHISFCMCWPQSCWIPGLPIQCDVHLTTHAHRILLRLLKLALGTIVCLLPTCDPASAAVTAGFYASSFDVDQSVNGTTICPQGFYCREYPAR